MIPLSDRQISEYLQRSYTAVDGLWFMKLEERLGFEGALDVDVAVWEVMPKIQARKLKELTGRTEGIAALHDCFTTKLTIEGYAFTTARDPAAGAFEVGITRCPWVDLLARSRRGHLADAIGRRLCEVEHTAWAREFGGNIAFEFGERLCAGCSSCVLRFRTTA
jgi:hypothetical protein